jgi:hypothetical protein
MQLRACEWGKDIPHLSLVVASGLHAGLGVTDLLQGATALLKVLGKDILLLSNLREEDGKLVGDVAQALILGGFTPVAQLAGDTL